MKKKMFTTGAILVSVFLLGACCTIVPGKVVYSKNLQDTIDNVDAKATILVKKDGSILVYNGEGNRDNVRKCRLPEPYKKTNKRQDTEADYTKDICVGMRKGSSVTSIQSITILKSNRRECITIGYDINGNPDEVCWDTP